MSKWLWIIVVMIYLIALKKKLQLQIQYLIRSVKNGSNFSTVDCNKLSGKKDDANITIIRYVFF